MPSPFSGAIGYMQNRAVLQAQQQAAMQAQQQEALRQQNEQAFSHQEQLNTEKAQRDLEEQRNQDIFHRKQQYDQQKNEDLQRQQKATQDFYAAVAKLPPTATNADLLGLASMVPGLPVAALSAAMRAREPGKPAALSATEKYRQQLVSQVTSHQFLNKDGSSPDPSMTVGEVLAAGGSPLTPKDADFYRNTISTEKAMDDLLTSGLRVLPAKPSGGFGLGTAIKKGERAIATYENLPNYLEYHHRRTAMIPYLRELTGGIGRVNQSELDIITGAFDQANTQQGLRDAVKVAKQIIQNHREALWRGARATPSAMTAGSMALPGVSGGGGGVGMAGLTPLRIEGGKVIYRGPDGKEYVQ
jgi:hypothetical protein